MKSIELLNTVKIMEMIADVLTKNLLADNFSKLKRIIRS